MKISAYIMANKSQEAPIPTPGEEITEGISWSYTTPAIYYTARNQNSSNFQPVGTYTVGSNTGGGYQYIERGDEGNVPCKVGWHKDLYADYVPGESYRYISSDVCITNVTGSVTVSGLTAGKYVVVIDHWVGCRSWSMFQEPDYHLGYYNKQAEKTIRQSANGIVYGEIVGIERYPGGGYEIGTLGGIHVRQKCNITIEEGETSKTITYGDSSFSLQALAGLHHYGTRNQDTVLSVFYSSALAINPRVYTDGGDS